MEMLSGAGSQAGRLPFPSKRGRNLDPLPPPTLDRLVALQKASSSTTKTTAVPWTSRRHRPLSMGFQPQQDVNHRLGCDDAVAAV
jgi:hypothetical protein